MSRSIWAAAGVLVAWWCCAASLAAIPQQEGAMTQQEYAKVRASAWRQLLLIQYDGIVAPRGEWPWTPEASAALAPVIEEKGDFRVYGVFEFFGMDVEEAVGEIRARGDAKLKDETAAADALLHDGKHAEAAEEFRSLAHQNRSAKWIANFYKRHADVARVQHELQTLHEAELNSSMGLAAWEIHAGKWWTEKDQAIGGVSQTNGLSLMHHLPITGDFELTADVEFHYQPFRDNFNISFYFNRRDGGEVVRVRLYLTEGRVRVTEGDGKPVIARADILKHSSVRIVVRGGVLDAFVNGQQVVRDIKIESYDASEPQRFGIGGEYWYEGARPKWRNFKLRLLKAKQAA